MHSRTPQEIWEVALGQLQLEVSRANYRTFFEKTRALSYQDDSFTIGVPNSFVGEYLDKNQRSLIEKALIGLTSPRIQVLFQVNGMEGPQNSARLPWTTGFIPPRLNPAYSFDAFIEGRNNRLARSAALAVAMNPGHGYNPLFVYGGAGLGKTHLLHAIGHMALANHVPVLCVSAEHYTNEFIRSVREHRTEEFRNKYRNAGMLLIDDIQFISGKEQTEESFFHTFNELHNANRQIVITSDSMPHAMPRLAERLRSRFEWGLTADVEPPDFEARMGILRCKAHQREVHLDPDVLEFIAGQDRRNIRELEGSLNRVIAYARLLNTVPDVEIAAKALENVSAKAPENGVSRPGLLLKTVAEAFQKEPDDLSGKARDKETAMARRVAMYFLRRETGLSLAQIGEELGGRDASAVTNACKKVSSEIAESPYLKQKIGEIQSRVFSPTK